MAVDRSFFWFRPSHRTFIEQAMGAAIFLLFSLPFGWFSGWLIQFSIETDWTQQIFSHRIFSVVLYHPAWALYHFFVIFSMWILWRRFSLKGLRLELAIFCFQLILQLGWSLSFFVFHEPRIALAALLFLWSNMILAILLYWKKECCSGQVLIPSFLWLFYVTGVNMAICIFNP